MNQQTQTNQIEWKEVEIGDLGKIITGSTPPKNDQLNYGSKTPWIKPPNLDNSMYVYQSDECLSEMGTQKARLLPAGSVLVSCIGNIGKIAVSGCEVCTNQQINSIIPNQDISPEFLYYDIKKNQKKIELMANKAVVPILNKTQFSKIKLSIPFSNGSPDLKEQERIVKILEESEKLNRKSKNVEKLFDEYLKSVFYEMFGNPVYNKKGWNQNILGDICFKITDGEHATPKLIDKGIPYLSAKNINEKIDFENIKYVDEETYKKITKRCLPEYGDILITCVGTIGRIKRIDIYNKFVFARSVALVKPNKTKIDNIFLEKMLSLQSMKKYMIGNTNEATVKGLYLKQINNLKVIVPPLPVQQKFASIVEQVEKMKKNISKTKQNSEELFNSLMQKAFMGEL